MIIFVIEDEAHAEWQGEYSNYEEALQELKSRANIPWYVEPNRCPCTSWKTCGRRYEIVEFDDLKGTPWTELSRAAILDVSSRGAEWNIDSKN